MLHISVSHIILEHPTEASHSGALARREQGGQALTLEAGENQPTLEILAVV